MGVDDQPGDLVGLIGHHGLVEEDIQWEIGEHPGGGSPLGVGLGGAPGQLITRAQRCCLGHDIDETVERVRDAGQLLAVHGGLLIRRGREPPWVSLKVGKPTFKVSPISRQLST